MEHRSDIVVIGAGHAGCEAALIAAKMGCDVILLTMKADKIAEMSCNPSIGGVGKGQLVKEIDALGGEMGKNADCTGIHFKRLNTRKGSAVQSSRCQSDKKQYANRMTGAVTENPRIRVIEGEAKAIVVEGGETKGVRCFNPRVGNFDLKVGVVVLTAGTFMRGVMHCGFDQSSGGRFGEAGSNGLSDNLRAIGLKILRLKTGTPARLERDSIDFRELDEQKGDEPPRRFSFSDTQIAMPQVSCFLGYTNSETHGCIRTNLHRSPLYSGKIRGIGPRYCPSIEDKVVKFPDKAAHHVFFEPESLSSNWIYPNGISTSLPAEVQEAFIRTLPGCRHVKIARFGYAVEYDCIDPTQLSHSLESKMIKGLFFAGQLNGTSGYEEAAAQGIMAGINAALKVSLRPALELKRNEAYIAVMIDDLVTNGITEPYRMFTSRAEYRLSIREDNADFRLRPYAIELGLVTDYERAAFLERCDALERSQKQLSRRLRPVAGYMERAKALGLPVVSVSQTIRNVLRRPEFGVREIESIWGISICDEWVRETLEIEAKYEGYIQMQQQEIVRLKKLRGEKIPDNLDYESIAGLSRELIEKLSKLRPTSLDNAASISGITPAALIALIAHLQKSKPRSNVET